MNKDALKEKSTVNIAREFTQIVKNKKILANERRQSENNKRKLKRSMTPLLVDKKTKENSKNNSSHFKKSHNDLQNIETQARNKSRLKKGDSSSMFDFNI